MISFLCERVDIKCRPMLIIQNRSRYGKCARVAVKCNTSCLFEAQRAASECSTVCPQTSLLNLFHDGQQMAVISALKERYLGTSTMLRLSRAESLIMIGRIGIVKKHTSNLLKPNFYNSAQTKRI